MQDRSFNKLVQLLETIDPNLNDNPAPVGEDHEVSMATTQIDNIIANALKIKDMMQSLSTEEDIEAWIQSKLTLADSYLNSVSGAMRTDIKLGQ